MFFVSINGLQIDFAIVELADFMLWSRRSHGETFKCFYDQILFLHLE